MNLFNELKRRNVFKVGAAYLVVAWLLVQVVATLGNMLELPKDDELRSSTPVASGNAPGGTAPVIVSPPPAAPTKPAP